MALVIFGEEDRSAQEGQKKVHKELTPLGTQDTASRLPVELHSDRPTPKLGSESAKELGLRWSRQTKADKHSTQVDGQAEFSHIGQEAEVVLHQAVNASCVNEAAQELGKADSSLAAKAGISGKSSSVAASTSCDDANSLVECADVDDSNDEADFGSFLPSEGDASAGNNLGCRSATAITNSSSSEDGANSCGSCEKLLQMVETLSCRVDRAHAIPEDGCSAEYVSSTARAAASFADVTDVDAFPAFQKVGVHCRLLLQQQDEFRRQLQQQSKKIDFLLQQNDDRVRQIVTCQEQFAQLNAFVQELLHQSQPCAGSLAPSSQPFDTVTTVAAGFDVDTCAMAAIAGSTVAAVDSALRPSTANAARTASLSSVDLHMPTDCALRRETVDLPRDCLKAGNAEIVPIPSTLIGVLNVSLSDATGRENRGKGKEKGKAKKKMLLWSRRLDVKCFDIAVIRDGDVAVASEKGLYAYDCTGHHAALLAGDCETYRCVSAVPNADHLAGESASSVHRLALLVAGNKTKKRLELLILSGSWPAVRCDLSAVLLEDNLPWCVAVDRAGRTVAVGSGRSVHLVSLEGSSEPTKCIIGYTVSALAYGSQALIVGSSEKQDGCYTLDARDVGDVNRVLWRQLLTEAVCSLQCERDSPLLYVLLARSQELRIFSATDGITLSEMPLGGQQLPLAAFDAYEKWFSLLQYNGTLKLFNLDMRRYLALQIGDATRCVH